MRIHEIIEARRFPEKSQKETGHSAALAWLLKLPSDELADYGVRMSAIPKLGINPSSRYDTPIGIYFYPADYYINIKQKRAALPFVDKENYIQIVKMSGNIFDLDMDAVKYGKYVSNLFNQIPTLINKFKIAQFADQTPTEELQDEMAKWVTHAPTNAIKNSLYGGRFWYILFELAAWLEENSASTRKPKTPGTESTQASRVSVVWNKLLNVLGFDTVIDRGDGIIHDNEENQGFALDSQSLKLVKIFKNFEGAEPKKEPEEANKKIEPIASVWNLAPTLSAQKKKPEASVIFSLLKSKKPPVEWIPYIRKFFITTGLSLTWAKNNQNLADVIVNRAISYLNKDPSLYSQLSYVDIDFLIKLSDNNPSVKNIMNKLTNQNFQVR